MPDKMDDLEFLARSKNRIAVLDALADGPLDSVALQRETGASRVTVGRIVSDLEDRGWIREAETGYGITKVGRAVADSFAELSETLDAAAVLEPLAASLPDEFLTIDIRHFRDAEVGVPSETDPLAAARVAAGLMGECEDVAMLAHAVTSETVANQIRATEERGQRSEVVLTAETFASMCDDPTMRSQLHQLLDLTGAMMYRYGGTVPVSMGIYDDEAVGIGTVDSTAFPNAFLVSRDATVLEWARETFADVRASASRIRREDVPD